MSQKAAAGLRGEGEAGQRGQHLLLRGPHSLQRSRSGWERQRGHWLGFHCAPSTRPVGRCEQARPLFNRLTDSIHSDKLDSSNPHPAATDLQALGSPSAQELPVLPRLFTPLPQFAFPTTRTQLSPAAEMGAASAKSPCSHWTFSP